MQIIPSHPHKTGSTAEIRFFDVLHEAFPRDDSFVAFHSLNLTHHRDKRFGEADFIIVCEFGLFVLEVKGGGVGVLDGGWHSRDKNKDKHFIQNPFRQAEGAMHAIVGAIKEHFKQASINIPYGFGVVLPDVIWNVSSAEWAPVTVCDSINIRNLEKVCQNRFLE